MSIRSDYGELMGSLAGLPLSERLSRTRYLARTDLYFLLRYLLNRPDVEHPWLVARIREVQREPDGRLDLWARGHYKSTVITYAKTIQDILASHGDEPLPEWGGLEPTFGIFSHTRPIAKAFLRQIKREFEGNEELKALFPDVLYQKPERDSPSWSEDNGITVRRKSNPKEATVEAWGLVDGQPTSKHFNVLLYDDAVTRESVTTPEMQKKTLEAWELSLNLGDRNPRTRLIGTRYHHADMYRTIMDRGAAVPRLHPATVDGQLNGRPVFLTKEEYEKKLKEMGPYTASAQLLQNPTVDSAQTIRREWLRHYHRMENWQTMSRALLVDPANEKSKKSDYTAMAVIGKALDRKLYLLDAVRDRMNLNERVLMAMHLHSKWRPHRTGWEKYGKDSDIQALQNEMERQNYRFDVVELGGSLSKTDRINRLIPDFANGDLWLPSELWRTGTDGKTIDIVQALIEQEILPWPMPLHDDLLDAIARIKDISLPWPRGTIDATPPKKPDRYRPRPHEGSWMTL